MNFGPENAGLRRRRASTGSEAAGGAKRMTTAIHGGLARFSHSKDSPTTVSSLAASPSLAAASGLAGVMSPVGLTPLTVDWVGLV